MASASSICKCKARSGKDNGYSKRLSLWERDQITILRLSGESVSGIARHLGWRCQKASRKERRTKIPHRVPSDVRPAVVAARSEFGHWEGNTLISRKSRIAVQSLSERRSRLVLLTKLARKGAVEMKNAVLQRFGPWPQADYNHSGINEPAELHSEYILARRATQANPFNWVRDSGSAWVYR